MSLVVKSLGSATRYLYLVTISCLWVWQQLVEPSFSFGVHVVEGVEEANKTTPWIFENNKGDVNKDGVNCGLCLYIRPLSILYVDIALLSPLQKGVWYLWSHLAQAVLVLGMISESPDYSRFVNMYHSVFFITPKQFDLIPGTL